MQRNLGIFCRWWLHCKNNFSNCILLFFCHVVYVNDMYYHYFYKTAFKERGHRSWQKRRCFSQYAHSWQFACFSVYFLCIVNHKSTSQFSKFVRTSFSRSKRGHLSIVCNEYFCDFAFTSFTKWMGLETYLGRRWGHYL